MHRRMLGNGYCARVAELSARREELAAHRDRLTAQLRTATPQLPSPEQLHALAGELKSAIDAGSPDVAKQVLEELIDRVEITHDRHACPYFYVPDSEKPGPMLARACSGTPVRMGSHHVEMVPPDTNRDRVALSRSPVELRTRTRHRGSGAAMALRARA